MSPLHYPAVSKIQIRTYLLLGIPPPSSYSSVLGKTSYFHVTCPIQSPLNQINDLEKLISKLLRETLYLTYEMAGIDETPNIRHHYLYRRTTEIKGK